MQTVLEALKQKMEMPKPPIWNYALAFPSGVDDEMAFTVLIQNTKNSTKRYRCTLAIGSIEEL